MRYLSLTSIWVAGLVGSLLMTSVNLNGADPTDDLSFTLGHSHHGQIYSVMSERRVDEVLSDRLKSLPKSQVKRLARHIIALSKYYRFDPAFILSLIEVESSFNPKAVSYVGALGLMQVMPPTAHFVIHQVGFHLSGYEPFKGYGLRRAPLTTRMLQDPFLNTAVGIAYLSWLRDYYRGLPPYYVFAAYNMGPARLDELRARPTFRPTETKKYYQAIVRGVPRVRYYQRVQTARLLKKRRPTQPKTVVRTI